MPLEIRTVARTASTNADMILLAADGVGEGVWLRAEEQSAGRGRLGRDWVSPRGNLYASTLVRPRSHDPVPATLSLVAAVALEETLRGWGADAVIKWPNDLVLAGAKLSGVLLERSGGAVIVGIGVNLASHPEGLDRPVTSFAAAGLGAPDPALFIADLAEAFQRWVAIWRGGLAPVRSRWLERAHPLGTPLAVRLPGAAPVEGLFDGLSADGALHLRLPSGDVQAIHAGDVFMI